MTFSSQNGLLTPFQMNCAGSPWNVEQLVKGFNLKVGLVFTASTAISNMRLFRWDLLARGSFYVCGKLWVTLLFFESESSNEKKQIWHFGISTLFRNNSIRSRYTGGQSLERLMRFIWRGTLQIWSMWWPSVFGNRCQFMFVYIYISIWGITFCDNFALAKCI